MSVITNIFTEMKATPTLFISLFLICFIGYAIGAVKLKGINLGTAGVFLFALLFGYLCTLPGLEKIPVLGKFYMGSTEVEKTKDAISANMTAIKLIANIGLVMFVTSVGAIAGPNFFRDLKRNAKTYVPMGVIIIVAGALVTVAFALIPKIGPAYATGVLSGALTSTPAYSAAKQAAGDAETLVTLGQAVAYPFGVIGVVLFVQIMPKLLKVDMEKERALICSEPAVTSDKKLTKLAKKRIKLDSYGFAAFGLILVLGIILGSVTIPLSAKGYAKDAPTFNLGMTGGPLIVALIFGHFGCLGPISMKIDEKALKAFREFGLMLFLAGSGFEGGIKLVSEIPKAGGPMIVVYGLLAGIVITVVPMIAGYIFARKVCKLPLLSSLGSITGGMTSTPALGTLIGVAGTDAVAGAYASTYPIALVLVVLASQLINTLM